MAKIQLKGIHIVRMPLANGKKAEYHYAWRKGPRLYAKPGTPEYLRELQAAAATRQKVDERTLKALIAEYKGSTDFIDLGIRTKADYERHLAKIENKFGDYPISGFDNRRTIGIFMGWRDELAAASRRQADYTWVVLGVVLNFAVRRGFIDRNLLAKSGRLYTSKRVDKVWSDEDEALWLEKAPEHLKLPLLLALWTGQRQGDLLDLRWEQYDGTHIRLVPGKSRTKKNPGGKRLMIPCGGPLRAALDAVRKTEGHVLLTSRSKDPTPWTEDGFRSSWAKAFDKVQVGDESLTFHDLRGTAVTRLARAGASVPEIATFTGHSLKDVQAILDAHYLSRDPEMAAAGLAKLEAHRAAETAKKAKSKPSAAVAKEASL